MATFGGEIAPRRSDIAKAGIASLTASSIEWYDFFIYLTAAALVFPSLFFPNSSAVAGVLAAFSTAAVGFVARPIGGVLFGHFGDRLGRKPTLVIALMLMGAATVLVGLLPSYATIGVAAPVLLFVLRFCQGLAIGGQWGGAVLLATEYAPPNRRGLFGSFAQTGVPVGVIFGNVVFLTISHFTSDAQFAAWGWRAPFLVGVLLIGVAMYIQLRLEDTPAFRQLEEKQEAAGTDERSPVLEVITQHPKQILLAGGAFFVVNGAFYILISGILDYGTRDLGLSSDAMLAAVLISSAVAIPATIGFAALTDRVGRRSVYLTGAVLLGLWGFPMFLMIDTKSIVLITIALALGQTFLSMMYGPQAALYAEMFTAKVRYSGASLGYQGASVFAGGLAPIIMVWLLAKTGTSLSVSFYILAMAAITFISVYLITETYEGEMSEDVAAESEAVAEEEGAATS